MFRYFAPLFLGLCSVLKCQALRLNTAFAEGFCCKMPEERQSDEVFRSILNNAWHKPVQRARKQICLIYAAFCSCAFDFSHLRWSFLCEPNIMQLASMQHFLDRPRAVQESELPEASQRSVAEHRLQPYSQPKQLLTANLSWTLLTSTNMTR